MAATKANYKRHVFPLFARSHSVLSHKYLHFYSALRQKL
jgi:hypothetical protein